MLMMNNNNLQREMNLRAQEKNRQIREMQQAAETQISDITREQNTPFGMSVKQWFTKLLK